MEALAATFFTSAAATGTAATVAGSISVGSGLAATLGIGQAAAPALTAGLLSSAATTAVGLSTFELISGSLSAFSAISSIAAGQTAKAASEEAALFEEFGAQQEILKGRKDALAISEAQNAILEQNIVDQFASGLTGEGSAKAAQEAIIEKAEFETDITRTGAVISAAARRTRAKQLKLEGKAAQQQGFTSAAKTVAGFFLNRARRGSAV